MKEKRCHTDTLSSFTKKEFKDGVDKEKLIKKSFFQKAGCLKDFVSEEVKRALDGGAGLVYQYFTENVVFVLNAYGKKYDENTLPLLVKNKKDIISYYKKYPLTVEKFLLGMSSEDLDKVKEMIPKLKNIGESKASEAILVKEEPAVLLEKKHEMVVERTKGEILIDEALEYFGTLFFNYFIINKIEGYLQENPDDLRAVLKSVPVEKLSFLKKNLLSLRSMIDEIEKENTEKIALEPKASNLVVMSAPLSGDVDNNLQDQGRVVGRPVWNLLLDYLADFFDPEHKTLEKARVNLRTYIGARNYKDIGKLLMRETHPHHKDELKDIFNSLVRSEKIMILSGVMGQAQSNKRDLIIDHLTGTKLNLSSFDEREIKDMCSNCFDFDTFDGIKKSTGTIFGMKKLQSYLEIHNRHKSLQKSIDFFLDPKKHKSGSKDSTMLKRAVVLLKTKKKKVFETEIQLMLDLWDNSGFEDGLMKKIQHYFLVKNGGKMELADLKKMLTGSDGLDKFMPRLERYRLKEGGFTNIQANVSIE